MNKWSMKKRENKDNEREKAHSSGSEGCTSAEPCSAHAMEQDIPNGAGHLK